MQPLTRAVHPALAQQFPDLQARIPWLPLGRWPTPVSRLERLGRLAGGAGLWVKRDDLSGELCGGNKVRKLEPLLGEALARGARRVLTVGGEGSNHVVACALYAREHGLGCRAVLVPQPETEHVRETRRLVRALGVEVIHCPTRLLVPARLALALAEDPAGSFLVGPGGSSPMGTLGFVAAGLELAGQVAAGALPRPDEIVLPLGSGGTTAGLLLGLAVARLDLRVVAVRVVERPLAGATLVRRLVRRTAARLGWKGRPGKLEVVHDQIGPGYGHVTPAAERAVALAQDEEGIKLETTYTGKAMAALLKRGSRGKRILFWNTHNSRDLSHLLGHTTQT